MHLYHRIQSLTRRRESTKDFQEARREKMWKIEGIFAEAKTYHGMGRARYRGRSKVQIQMYMSVGVQNLIGALDFILWHVASSWPVDIIDPPLNFGFLLSVIFPTELALVSWKLLRPKILVLRWSRGPGNPSLDAQRQWTLMAGSSVLPPDLKSIQ